MQGAPEVTPEMLPPELGDIILGNIKRIFAKAWAGANAGKRLPFGEWIETHRELPPTAAHKGKMLLNRVPYIRGIAEVLTSQEAEYKIVVCRKGAQLTFSELCASLIGYIIHQDPVPVLYFSETLPKAESFYRDRVRPMLNSEAFTGIIAPTDIRAGGAIFPGGTLELRGSNSPNAFSSSSAAVIILDEFARYPKNVSGEGDPISLAKTRARSYRSRGKLFIPSTPVDEDDGEGGFSAAYELGDCREYFMPCPSCGEYDYLRFADFVTTDTGGKTRGGFVCKKEGCGVFRWDEDKDAMIAAGEWRPTRERTAADFTSFHCPGTLSPFVSWTEIAEELKTAATGKTSKAAIINTHFGDPYREESDEIPTDPKTLRNFAIADRDRGIVPDTSAGLTLAVDIQDGNAKKGIAPWIAWAVWSWEEHFRGHLVDWGILDNANIGTVEGRADLDALIKKQWRREDGKFMMADIAAIDSGNRASEVYSFVHKYPRPGYKPALGWALSGRGVNVIAVKGFGQGRFDKGLEQNSALRTPEKLKVAKYQKYGIRLWRVNTNWIKARFFAALNYAAGENEREGAVSFPNTLDEEICEQFLSERVEITRNRSGIPVRKYVKIRERNEALDLAVYARAAAAVLAGDTFGEDVRVRLAKRRGGYVAPSARTGTESAKPEGLPPMPTPDMYYTNLDGKRVLRKQYRIAYKRAGISV